MNFIGAGRAIQLAEAPLYKPHLWFVLTDPEGSPPRVVAVMLRTATAYTDSTLILQPGDHPFVRHESSVHYSTARYFSVAAINREIKTGRCHLHPDIGTDLLERVRAGLLRSPYTVRAIADYCAEQFRGPDSG